MGMFNVREKNDKYGIDLHNITVLPRILRFYASKDILGYSALKPLNGNLDTKQKKVLKWLCLKEGRFTSFAFQINMIVNITIFQFLNFSFFKAKITELKRKLFSDKLCLVNYFKKSNNQENFLEHLHYLLRGLFDGFTGISRVAMGDDAFGETFFSLHFNIVGSR